jgi:hypothetical protein
MNRYIFLLLQKFCEIVQCSLKAIYFDPTPNWGNMYLKKKSEESGVLKIFPIPGQESASAMSSFL